VFSLPRGQAALNLRQERYGLKTLVRDLFAAGRAVELQVLQYGATRAALQQALRDGRGWDLLHFSGHGLNAQLVLEGDDGGEDRIPSDRLAELLRPARGRLKWVTLSACLSAAPTIAETLRWLGLEPRRETAAVEEPEADIAPLPTPLPALAEALALALEWTEQQPELTCRAGLGHWTRLLDEVQRLQCLNRLGRWGDVLGRVEALRAEMATLAEQSSEEETSPSWTVREGLLNTGRSAAWNLAAWEQALAFNAAVLASRQARGRRPWNWPAPASTTTLP